MKILCSPICFSVALLLNPGLVCATSMISPANEKIYLKFAGGSAALDCARGQCIVRVHAESRICRIDAAKFADKHQVNPNHFKIYSEYDGFDIDYFSIEVGVECPLENRGNACFLDVLFEDCRVSGEPILVVRKFSDQ